MKVHDKDRSQGAHFNEQEGSGDHLFRSGCGLESSACDFPASTSPRDFLAWEAPKFQINTPVQRVS